MKAWQCSKYYFLPSFDKNKILVGYCLGSSDDVTNDDQKTSLICMALKATLKFRLSS